MVDGCRRRTAFVDVLDHLGKIVLYGGHGGDDGWCAETVRDEREVGEVSLEGWVEHGRRPHRSVR